MFLKAQIRRKMTHFIAACGRAYTVTLALIFLGGTNCNKQHSGHMGQKFKLI